MECRVNTRFYSSFCFKRNWTDRVQVGPHQQRQGFREIGSFLFLWWVQHWYNICFLHNITSKTPKIIPS
jgi:hypothetical protein